MQLPSLKALRAFHTVAKLGSLSHAADELAVTTSAVSHQIKNLEASVGVALVARAGRGVRLTEDGRALAGGLADGFARIADAVEELRGPVQGGKLRITVPPIFASNWLIPRIERFNALRPETEVVLIDSRERTGVSSSNGIVIDWGIFEDDAIMFAERLTEGEEVFPVCSPGACPGPGLSGATLLHREVTGESWDWPDWPTFLAAVGLDDAGIANGPALTARLLFSAARQGKGVVLSNTTVARRDLARGRLVRPIAESMAVDQGYWILTLRAVRGRPEVRAFVSWMKEEFARDFERVS